MPKRNAQGGGSIRQRKDGTWEARYTLGRDPGTGKQKQRSVYGKTQAGVLKKLQDVQADMNNGTYTEPSKMTVGQWMDVWSSEYLGGVKESTQASYKAHIRNHIKPSIGSVLLQKLTPHLIQTFYNGLTAAGKSAKTVKNLHGVMHGAMGRAVKLGYIKINPTDACTLPRAVKPDIKVMDSDTVTAFLGAIQGHRFEGIYFVDLFTGMRQAEILGLPWKNIDFQRGTILIDQQLVKSKIDGRYFIDTTKHDKVRTISPAPIVMEKLKLRKSRQAADQLRAGTAWSDKWGLVFTDEIGKHLVHETVSKTYKRIVVAMGEPALKFHSLRHSYAVISLMSGDDVKTVQENLGHHTAAFTLDTYGHSTEQMKAESAKRMEEYIKSVSNKA